MSLFESRIFDEPELEFGDRHHHPDPRLGLCEAGPLQTFPGDLIKVGVVGSAKTIADTRTFMETVAAGWMARPNDCPISIQHSLV